jgi:L-fuconolactonase
MNLLDSSALENMSISYQESSIKHPASRIDSHQHFWNYDSVRHDWINDEMKVLKQDYFPENLSPILQQNKIDGCVAVQADQSERETEFLLELAEQNPFIKGVVGWVDFRSDKIEDQLDYYSQFKKLKGFRHVVQGEPAGFLSQKKFLAGIGLLEKHNLTYDVLIYHYQLSEAIAFVRHFPNQKFVVDHLAKPDIKQQEFINWSKGMKQLASFENVFCKLSGFTTEAKWNSWKPEDFTPYFDFALDNFGVKRLMYGSDWPVCLLASSYKSQLHLVENFISKLSISEKQQIMGGNAIDFYNL